jgi:hypothetical protein
MDSYTHITFLQWVHHSDKPSQGLQDCMVYLKLIHIITFSSARVISHRIQQYIFIIYLLLN